MKPANLNAYYLLFLKLPAFKPAAIKPLFVATLLLILLSVSSATRAQVPADQFVNVRISSLQLFSAFASFIYFQGNDKSLARVQTALQKGDAAISALPDSETELKDKWQQITDYVAFNKNHKFDGVSMSLEAGWSIQQREFNKMIDQRTPKNLTGLDDVQIKMEIILSQYMGYANSTTGGYGVSYALVPLEKRINSVSQQLEILADKNPEYQELQKRWNYIQNTLLSYNSNVAPFVVLHTFEKMRAMIAAY